MLREFAAKQQIPYRLLSDLDSEVIRRYGILNDQVVDDGAFLSGIPYPGVYVTDESGVVVAKFFHDTYKKRDSPEALIDAALGRPVISDDTPRAEGQGEEVRVTAYFHGGQGTLRQGVIRNVVVHCELAEGMHVYGEPVPEGMVPFSVEVEGPPGLIVQEASKPESETLRLESMGMELPILSGSFDVVVPVYPDGQLASECRPLDQDRVEVEVRVRYQACNDEICLPPRTETFRFDLALDVVDVPKLGMHLGHGQREGNYSSAPHMARLAWRKIRKNPLGLLRLIKKTIRVEREAKQRARQAKRAEP